MNTKPIKSGGTYQFTYRNWRGVTETRTVQITERLFMYYGRTGFHSEEAQLFLQAFCLDRNAARTFVCKDIDWDTFVEIFQ